VLRRIALILTIFCGALVPLAPAQQPTKVSLDVSETLFSVITAINACGYDQDLASADPLRLRIRAEVNREVENSPAARYALKDLCAFYRDHQQSDSSRDLAQYVSLALNLGAPPAFTPNVKEADLPPDAAYVLGIQHVLQTFYTAANLHGIWLRNSKDYESFIDQNNEAVAKMLTATDVYLKIPVGGYAGRRLSIFIEPMAAVSQSNARNYETDYFIVLSPDNGGLKIDQIRHTYLHFVLDPMAMRRGTTLQRLAPLLDSVATAPIDNSYKTDIALLVTESLIRAIEARTEPGKGKDADLKRQQKANEAAREGFILAPYFYDQLTKFEKDPVGLQDAYGDWLHYIDVQQEKHRASQIQFAATSVPEVVRAAKPANPLDEAEKYFASGDFTRARELAQKALDSPLADSGRTHFLLARIAISTKDMSGAQTLFEKAIQVSHEPRVIAWSNIYLGRIYDLKSDRETAVKRYRAALEAGDSSSITKAAAERGLKQPYQPPSSQTPQGTQQ
jgi:tetratricopeptide (TPR) repeat protein